jgi:hypothetical protein
MPDGVDTRVWRTLAAVRPDPLGGLAARSRERLRTPARRRGRPAPLHPPAPPCDTLAPMVLGLGAWAATFGLVVVFFVIFPVLVQGLLAFAIAQVFGERAENQEYARHHRMPGS